MGPGFFMESESIDIFLLELDQRWYQATTCIPLLVFPMEASSPSAPLCPFIVETQQFPFFSEQAMDACFVLSSGDPQELPV